MEYGVMLAALAVIVIIVVGLGRAVAELLRLIGVKCPVKINRPDFMELGGAWFKGLIWGNPLLLSAMAGGAGVRLFDFIYHGPRAPLDLLTMGFWVLFGGGLAITMQRHLARHKEKDPEGGCGWAQSEGPKK